MNGAMHMTDSASTVTQSDIHDLFATMRDCIDRHAEELTALDQAIGDGDHGINMKRGFDAVMGDMETIAAKPLPDALKAAGMKLVMSIGGASGPLYGTLFMTLGKQLPAPFGRVELASAFDTAVDAVAARGKSERGQKTMLDVLYPVAEVLRAGKEPDAIVAIADEAAEATVPLQALRGRASFLAERSVGHMDPGARSSALLVGAVVRLVTRDGKAGLS